MGKHLTANPMLGVSKETRKNATKRKSTDVNEP
jgi:hypothetical protein